MCTSSQGHTATVTIQVKFICKALFTIPIVAKQLYWKYLVSTLYLGVDYSWQECKKHMTWYVISRFLEVSVFGVSWLVFRIALALLVNRMLISALSHWSPSWCPLAAVMEPCGMFQSVLIRCRCFKPVDTRQIFPAPSTTVYNCPVYKRNQHLELNFIWIPYGALYSYVP